MSNENKNTEVATIKKDVTTQVLDKITAFEASGELSLPKGYNVQNALKSAYIILSDPKNNLLSKCDKSSVAEALLKMVVYGVSPIKKQCYFIPYGNKLECSISYAGNIAIAKRYGKLKNIKGNAIFKGDDFEFGVDQNTGRKKVIKHNQTLDSIGSNEIIGAYAVYELNDGSVDVEVMNINQIKQSWAQGGSKGNSPAHKNFPDQMAVKTVLNRACKLLISSSDDSVLYDPLDDNSENIDVAAENVKYEVKTKANKKTIGFDEDADYEEVKEEPANEDEENERLYNEAMAEQESKHAKGQPEMEF
ncbi:recombinase RecT [Salinimicrobium sp. GXAS 041]|uniref:recombinase RecT n=1 Tax=Salinimicrobium sp. GXAS 041 TaxID=3400806 RepID=UPI003C71E8BF